MTDNNTPTTTKRTRSEQSRINGAQSKGPTSTEGKAKSSKNSMKHGFAAVINVVLAVEDPDEFNAHVAGFRAGFRPQDYVEQTLIDELAAIKWRKSRIVALETAIIDVQLSTQEEALNREHPKDAHDPYFHLALAWNALATVPERPDADQPSRRDSFDMNSLELLRRYQSSLDRQYRNAQHNLREYRQNFAPAAPAMDVTPEQPVIAAPQAQESVGAAQKAKLPNEPGEQAPPIVEPRPTPLASAIPIKPPTLLPKLVGKL